MIEKVLLKRGGMLSTDLKEYLMNTLKITADTARKRISRTVKSNPNICRLHGLSFRNRAAFYYHKNAFGSPDYWKALYGALKQAKSSYSYAIAALIARKDAIPTEHFAIQCGAPERMAKNLSYTRILADLKGINAIREDFVPKVGECISLIQDDEHFQLDGEKIKARLIAEDMLIDAVSVWLKRLNFASYEKVALNRKKKSQLVNGFYWDISAPSFLTSITTSKSEGRKQPGFVVCDVMLDSVVDEVALSSFLNKVRKSQFSHRQGRCMYFLVAEYFTNEAFDLARRAGVVPATVRNLFGKDVDEALKSVISVFSHLASLMNDPAQIDDLFSRLQKVEGAVGNLRGTLFEFIVAEAFRKIYPKVELGRKIQSTTSLKKYDADVMINLPLETIIIECKSGYAGRELFHEEVLHWLQEQVPNMYKALAKQDNDASKRKYVFELWSTKSLSVESLRLIEEAINTLSKYSICFRQGNEVREKVAEANEPALLNLLDQHYLKHPFQKN